MTALLDSLRWVKHPVLNDGFVCLVDVMGDDDAIVQAARISYNKDHRDSHERVHDALMKLYPSGLKDGLCSWTPEQLEAAKAEFQKDSRGLIRYLMRNRHTTPFEMAEIKLLVRVPMDCWRQWIRHRTANVNEYSTRYTEAIDSCQVTDPGEWRVQSQSNKQGSGDGGVCWPETLTQTERDCYDDGQDAGRYLSHVESEFQRQAHEVYNRRLAFGVAREQARKDLPLSTYTEAYWKIDLHNLLHFLGLRMDPHAQKEIRDYATIIGEKIVAPLFPVVWEAFCDYRLGAMTLSRLDIEVISAVMECTTGELHETIADTFTNNRERDECIAKLKRLGLLPD